MVRNQYKLGNTSEVLDSRANECFSCWFQQKWGESIYPSERQGVRAIKSKPSRCFDKRGEDSVARGPTDPDSEWLHRTR
jgi:hypothetical protein